MAAAGDEAKIRKVVDAAEKDLTRLAATLQKTLMLVKQDKFSDKKAKAVVAKVLAAIKKHKGVQKLRGGKDFDALPEDLKDRVVWIDALMAALLATQDKLQRAVKLLKREPESGHKVLMKAGKEAALQIGQAPKHIAVMIKQIRKGIDADSPLHEKLATLPMIMTLTMVSDAIVQGLRDRP
jgi:hypothetical protein